jgi:hypothetical protein
MALIFQPGFPDQGRALAVAGVDRLLRQSGRGVDSGLRAARPHRSFSCGLVGAAADVVSHARFAAWRYLVFRGEECVAAAEVEQRPEDPSAILSSLVSGVNFAAQLVELDWVAGLAEVEQAGFELRFLRVPGLAVMAWWLSRRSGGRGDLFAPVPPSQGALRPHEHTLYSGAEAFSQAVRPLAQKKQEGAKRLFAGLPEQ